VCTGREGLIVCVLQSISKALCSLASAPGLAAPIYGSCATQQPSLQHTEQPRVLHSRMQFGDNPEPSPRTYMHAAPMSTATLTGNTCIRHTIALHMACAVPSHPSRLCSLGPGGLLSYRCRSWRHQAPGPVAEQAHKCQVHKPHRQFLQQT
jgi:hypothetical protein